MAVISPLQLSVPPVLGELDPGRRLGRTYCMGEVELYTLSGQHTRPYIWRADYDAVTQGISICRVDDEVATRVVLFSSLGEISTYSFTLDYAMYPVVTYRLGELWYIYWYDKTQGLYRHDSFYAISAICVTDEFRIPYISGFTAGACDLVVLLANPIQIWYKTQADGYFTETYLGELQTAAASLLNAGVSNQMRLQIEALPMLGVG